MDRTSTEKKEEEGKMSKNSKHGGNRPEHWSDGNGSDDGSSPTRPLVERLGNKYKDENSAQKPELHTRQEQRYTTIQASKAYTINAKPEQKEGITFKNKTTKNQHTTQRKTWVDEVVASQIQKFRGRTRPISECGAMSLI